MKKVCVRKSRLVGCGVERKSFIVYDFGKMLGYLEIMEIKNIILWIKSKILVLVFILIISMVLLKCFSFYRNFRK